MKQKMDMSNLTPTQGSSGADGDTTMESDDWRDQLPANQRETITNAIPDHLRRHIPFPGHEELQELKKIAERVEEEIYTASTSQLEYYQMIVLNFMVMETGLQKNRTLDPGSSMMQQVKNLGQHVPIHVPSDNIQQMRSQSMYTNIGSTGMQGASSLSSAMPPDSGLQQPPMANVSGQNSNLQDIQNMSSVQQQYLIDQQYNNRYNSESYLHQQQLMNQQMKQSSLRQQSQQLHYNFLGQQMPQQQQPPMHNMLQQQGLIAQQNGLSSLQQPPQQLSDQNVNLQNIQNMSRDQGTLHSNQTPTQQQNQESSAANMMPQIMQSSQFGQFQQPHMAMPAASSTSLDSTAQSGYPNDGYWQEEVNQEAKAMKDLHI